MTNNSTVVQSAGREDYFRWSQREERPVKKPTDNQSGGCDFTQPSTLGRFSTHHFLNNDRALLVDLQDLLQVALVRGLLLLALHCTGLRSNPSSTWGTKPKHLPPTVAPGRPLHGMTQLSVQCADTANAKEHSSLINKCQVKGLKEFEVFTW